MCMTVYTTLHNVEFRGLYTPPSIVRIMKLGVYKEMRMGRQGMNIEFWCHGHLGDGVVTL